MTIAPFLSLAAAAGGTLAAVATGAVQNVASFVDALHSSEEPQPTDASLTAAAPTSVGETEKAARDALQQFHEQLQRRLAELGIDVSQPITLALDGLGNIRETSGHPQAAQIEQLLASEDGLARQFEQAAAQFERLRADREQAQFAEVYAKNPELAAAQYGHLLDDRREVPTFSLQLLGDHAEPSFA